jgi:hypothetical protein
MNAVDTICFKMIAGSHRGVTSNHQISLRRRAPTSTPTSAVPDTEIHQGVVLTEISMNRLLIATAALLVLGAPLALAESNTLIIPPVHKEHREHKDKVASVAMDQKCQALGSEFDTTAGKYHTAQGYLDAIQAAAQGKTFCAAHNDTAGIQKYDLAFKMLGVKPSAT